MKMHEIFKEAWNMTWDSIYLLTRKMFITTLVMLYLSGILTWYGIGFLGLQERNMLIAPLLKFGASWIFVWVVIAMTLTSIIYGTTRKSRNIHCIMITFLFIGATFDVLNNIGQVFGIALLSAIGNNSPNPFLLIKSSLMNVSFLKKNSRR